MFGTILLIVIVLYCTNIKKTYLEQYIYELILTLPFVTTEIHHSIKISF